MESRPRIALLVRGHERGAFGDASFAAYAKGLGSRLGGAEVVAFVHTWAESEAKISHRPLSRAKVRPVSEGDVRAYLGGVVAWVGVDDDDRIDLPGSTDGMIGGIPARAWKNMWYGKRRAAEAIERYGAVFDLVVCVRVDNFLNMESRRHAMINTESMDAAVRAALSCSEPEKVRFARGVPCPGVDNFYVGRPRAVIDLINRFHYDMDSVRARYPTVRHQEYMVFYEATNMARANSSGRLL